MLGHFFSAIIDLVQSHGYVAIFILMALESALIPIPSEIVMPFAGFLAEGGVFSLPVVIFVGALANVAGSLVGYYIGYLFPEATIIRWINAYGKFILLHESDYMKSRMWFEKWGSGVAFFSRLVPGVRTFISLPAGIFRMPIGKFVLYTFLGSLIWSALLTYIGFYLGAQWVIVEAVFRKFHMLIIAFSLVLIGYFIYHQVSKRRSD